MAYKVLTNSEVEQFMELGWVKVEEAFPRNAALAGQDVVWRNLEKRGFLKNDPSTWTEPKVSLQENYDDDEFQLCCTRRFADSIEDLVGEGRWARRAVYGETPNKEKFGWWQNNFAIGADKPWDVPTAGWHWDGIHFRHAIDTPNQGLLCLCLFSEVAHHGGGTLIAEGSHKIVAKFLAQCPNGIELKQAIPAVKQGHPWIKELSGFNEKAGMSTDIYANENEANTADSGNRIEKFMNTWHTDAEGVKLRVVETTGLPGDVFLCHPFLFHSASQNHLGVPRIMTNKTTPLKERLQLRRTNVSSYSPLENSIRRALAYD